MNTSTYIPEKDYQALIKRLVTIKPTSDQPCVRSAIIELIGETLNVWPDSIRPGALHIVMSAA